MSGRFSDLTPITHKEYESIGIEAFGFFQPLNSIKYRKEHGLSYTGPITPLNGMQFYHYLVEKDKAYENKLHKARKILELMERGGILSSQGYGNSAMMGKQFFSLKELTNCQKTNLLWLGDAFGLAYLKDCLADNVVHIVGETKKGDIGNGSGFLVSQDTVLTCKHVLEDMRPEHVLTIKDNEYSFDEPILHPGKDMALLKLEKPVKSITAFPVFNTVEVMEEVLIMGYPPIPATTDAYVLCQKGEVNAVVNEYLNNTKNIVLSAVTRPGNSGGPVISKNGYLVGMVTELTEKESISLKATITDTTNSKKEFPFFMAISGYELYKSIKEMDPECSVYYEDYQ